MHPDLGLGFEVVGSSPMGDTPDAVRVLLVKPTGLGAFRILSAEDMIADRMGQFASGAAPEMLDQARRIAALYADLDIDYLRARIRTETLGDHNVEDLDP